MGAEGCKVIMAAYARALADEIPVIGLWHSGGARLAEGVVSLHAVGEVFNIMTRASGRIPQISVVLGAAAGGAAYGPALTDIVILGPNGTGLRHRPRRRPLGHRRGRRPWSASVAPSRTRVAAAWCTSPRRPTKTPSLEARDLTSLLGRAGRARAGPPRSTTSTSPRYLPESDKRAYDVHPLVEHLLDAGTPRRAARAVGAEHRHHARTPRRPHRRRDRQQPAAPGRLPRLALGREGRALRPHVRRVRRPARRRRRRPRLPARCRPGVGGRRPPRRQAAARLRRGRRPPRHGRHAQGVRRRLHRHELARTRRHPGVRLAGRDRRGHGLDRGGPHPAPAQAGRPARGHPGRDRARAGRRARADRRRHREGQGPRRRRRGRSSRRHHASALAAAIVAAAPLRGRHGNIPL